MTKAWNLCLVLMLAVPAHAQDRTPVEEVAGESAPDSELETIPVDQEAAEEEPAEPWKLYAGVDLVNNTLSSSSLPGFGGDDFGTGMYRLRLGARVLESISLELHYGMDSADEGSGELATDRYYGLFVAPAATVLDTVELTFPVGYARTRIGENSAKADLDSIGYGVDAELPLRFFSETLPDLRLTAGGMVYYQKSDARLYGANVGLRYDFQTAGFGNPFSGLDLWPFGDDAEQIEEGS